MGDYKSALQYYLSVNRQEMKEFQVWRYVKLIEQIGFCYHQLGDEPEGRRYFKKVLAWYRKLPMDERVVPTELLQCLDPTDPIVTEIKQIEDYLD